MSAQVITAASLTVDEGGTVLCIGVTDPESTSFAFTSGGNVTHGAFQTTTDWIRWAPGMRAGSWSRGFTAFSAQSSRPCTTTRRLSKAQPLSRTAIACNSCSMRPAASNKSGSWANL